MRNLLKNERVINSRKFNQLEILESETMAVAVSIPTILRPYTGNARSVEVSGDSLKTLISNLDEQFPGLGDRLLENGQLRRFVNIYINDEDVRFMGSLDAQLSDGDSVTILPAVAGG
jgi:molybdopterin converting factor small subunit